MSEFIFWWASLCLFKNFLEKELESSKNYKSELKWFDGTWSRFKPGLGKDKKGASGVDEKLISSIGKKIYPTCCLLRTYFIKSID